MLQDIVKHAVTVRQREMTDELIHQSRSLVENLESFLEMRRKLPLYAWEGETASEVALYMHCRKRLPEEMKALVENTAAKHGFVMMGNFLYHPEEMPFAEFDGPAKDSGE